ncbi:hypothetical protein JQ596_22435 [Bradyrhizobium manausense]|uniref:hypothetical protein n=1 Tax=Bradyrhizobium TaxID=374 RepID=UPI001BA9A0A3|nr:MULTISPECIES: hypothetical protein [Bradyrhizobium]MBR0828297.1 hypothetical protein [Bradyrhizobium manausense]UVO33352.1 hypothetical protein KUF59_23865 [Bradyrhizobium arachidis]
MSPIIAATAAISIASAATGLAAELPTYEANGLPISSVQVAVLGAAHVRQSQVSITAPSPHQVRVLKLRPKLTATAAAGRNDVRAAN